MYTKRQITEAKKRHEIISDLLSAKANINHIGIDFEEGQMYFKDNDNYFKEYTLFTFHNYKTLKEGQKYIIDLLKVVDHVIDTDLLSIVHN